MKIITYEDQYLSSLNVLLEEAFQVVKVGTREKEDIELIAVLEDKVIGYLLLNRCFDSVRGFTYFFVAYVCVKKEFQGQGVATKLLEEVFSICKKENISYLELTSNPSREAAHHLYAKLGFQVRNTTVFRKEFL